MNYQFEGGTASYVTTSGASVLGISGQPVNLLGVLVGACTAPIVSIFSGQAATATVAYCTMPANAFTRFPYASPNGVSYRVTTGAGDAVLRLTFFWIPGQTT